MGPHGRDSGRSSRRCDVSGESNRLSSRGDALTEVPQPQLQGRKIRRAALVFVVGSIVILGVTLWLTMGEETWQGVAALGGGFVALLLAVESLRMLLEAFGLLVLVNCTQGERITLIESLELTLEAYFIGQLIPLSAAGVPYQGFLLTRKGVRAGWATALVIVKGFIPGVFFSLVLVVTAILAALKWEGVAEAGTFLKVVGPLSALPIGLIVTVLVIMLKFPALFDRIVDRIAAFLARKLPAKASQRVEEARVMLEEESHIFRDALSALGRHRRVILMWGVLLIVFAFIAEFTVAVVILWGFGYWGSGIMPVILQCLLKPILVASPTPGSLGVGEGAYIAFFAVYLPAHFVGVSLVLWRLVVSFLPMFVGGVLVAKRIGRRGFDLKRQPDADSDASARA